MARYPSLTSVMTGLAQIVVGLIDGMVPNAYDGLGQTTVAGVESVDEGRIELPSGDGCRGGSTIGFSGWGRSIGLVDVANHFADQTLGLLRASGTCTASCTSIITST